MSVPTDVMATRSLASSLGASAPRNDARERAAMTSVGTDTLGPQFKAPCSIAGEVFIVLYSRGINLKTELLVSTVPTWFEYLGDLLATVNLKIILKLKD